FDGGRPSVPVRTPRTHGGWFPLLIGDFDGDLFPDLLTSDQGVALRRGVGDGRFRDPDPPFANGDAMLTADFDGDGRLDVYVENTGRGVLIHLGRGDGTFKPALPFDGGVTPMRAVADDFDGDGRLDLVLLDKGRFDYEG